MDDSRTRKRLLAVAFGLATVAVSRTAAAQPAGVGVAGTVYDSVARAPLAGADVQLIRQDTAGVPEPHGFFATTDSAGRFRIANVPAGAYIAGFFHPVVDSLGIEAAARRVDVAAGRDVRLDLGLPAPTTIVRAICGRQAGDSATLVVGYVRDAAARAPRPDAAVRIAWSDVVLARDGFRRAEEHVETHTLPNGWFGACGVPMGATMTVQATADADSSAARDVDLGARRVVRHDVYLGGTAALRGLVRATSGRPIAGARVALAGTRDTAVAGDDGTFAFARVRAGSQTLEVRAVGYLPARTPVDLFAGDVPNTTTVSLLGLRAYLDTVRVRGDRVYHKDASGFEQRRRAWGSGSFLDRAAIARRVAFQTTDLLRTMPGVQVVHGMDGEHVLVRNMGSPCSPTIYIDGMQMTFPGMASGAFADEANIIQPEEIEAIEVYRSAASTPPQFAPSMSGCGSILIWTGPQLPKPRKLPKASKQKTS